MSMVNSNQALSVAIAHRIHERLTLDVSFTLGNERAVLFGESGAGKTTLFRLMAGLARPERGVVRLDGATLFDAARRIDVPPRARRMGMIFQDDRLFPHLNVARNIAFGLHGWRRVETSARVDQVAQLCNVAHLLGRRVDTLSGGERQRVGLARALAPRPRVLLCDEPVSALDLTSRYVLIDRLKGIQRAEGIPLLFITHSPAEAIALGERVLLLRGGRIEADGAPLDVLAAGGVDAGAWGEAIRNLVEGVVVAARDEPGAWVVALDRAGETVLRLPREGLTAGAKVRLSINADEILLAVGSMDGAGMRLSARNLLAGVVERIVGRGSAVEVVTRVGETRLTASLVRAAVEDLGLCEGKAVTLIIKARGIQVLEVEGPAG